MLKIVFEESESAALRAWLLERHGSVRISSDLARIEVHRSTLRRDHAALTRAVSALTGIHILPMSERVVAKALSVGDPLLRTLDAIHLASAAMLGPRLTAFDVYDKRLYAAAEAESMPVVAPSN